MFDKGDDYVRLVLTTAEGATGNASRNELLPFVKRFAGRQQSKRILKTIYESEYYLTPGGLVVRQQFVIEGERLDAFAKRLVKALFYVEKRYRLPDDCLIHAINYRRMGEAERLAGPNKDFYASILTELQHQEHRAWGDVFGYSWVQSPNHSDATWWLLDFYGKPQYLCNTLGKEGNCG